MRNQVSKFFFIVFISLFSSLCAASNEEDNLNKLLLLSGITKQIGEFPSLVKGGFKQGIQQDDSFPEDKISLILNSVDKTILPSVVLDEIKHLIDKSLNNEDVEKLLEWYESDIGKKITVAEENASTAEAYQHIVNSAQQLLANTKRVDVAARFDELLGATDMGLDMQKFSSVAVYSAMMIALAPDQELNLDAFNSQMEAVEPQMRASLQQLVSMSFVYAYQEINDDDLAKYEVFLNRPITMKFNDSAIKGINAGFKKIIADWVVDLVVILKNKVS